MGNVNWNSPFADNNEVSRLSVYFKIYFDGMINLNVIYYGKKENYAVVRATGAQGGGIGTLKY